MCPDQPPCECHTLSSQTNGCGGFPITENAENISASQSGKEGGHGAREQRPLLVVHTSVLILLLANTPMNSFGCLSSHTGCLGLYTLALYVLHLLPAPKKQAHRAPLPTTTYPTSLQNFLFHQGNTGVNHRGHPTASSIAEPGETRQTCALQVTVKD